MWSANGNNIMRHIFGGHNGKYVSLCGKTLKKGPLNYLKINLPMCQRCKELAGKEANSGAVAANNVV